MQSSQWRLLALEMTRATFYHYTTIMASSFISKILLNAPPTTDARSERQLAAALGYPLSWHVVRLAPDKPDVIYAGNPRKNVALWFNHEAARAAAAEWQEGKSCPYKGGHLLPRKPKFKKSEVVEVLYKKKWYPATVTKRKEVDGQYLYSVLYSKDQTTQEDIRESKIRQAPPDAAALHLAATLGFPEGWRAVYGPKNRLQFYNPDNAHFKSKKAALDHLAALEEADDPPWRVDGHEFIGKQVKYVAQHKVSGTRTVEIVQTGTVTGWISEQDKDRQGEPGYVCEETGKPAALFRVEFQDDPSHPYRSQLIDFQDMEEHEVLDMLLNEQDDNETEEPPAKRAKLQQENGDDA
jgi:hypothetical protein